MAIKSSMDIAREVAAEMKQARASAIEKEKAAAQTAIQNLANVNNRSTLISVLLEDTLNNSEKQDILKGIHPHTEDNIKAVADSLMTALIANKYDQPGSAGSVLLANIFQAHTDSDSFSSIRQIKTALFKRLGADLEQPKSAQTTKNPASTPPITWRDKINAFAGVAIGKLVLPAQWSTREHKFVNKLGRFSGLVSWLLPVNDFKDQKDNLKKDNKILATRHAVIAADGASLDKVQITPAELLDQPLNQQRYTLCVLANGDCYENQLDEMRALAKGEFGDSQPSTVIGFNFRNVRDSKGSVKSQGDLVNDVLAQVQRLMAKGVKPENITLKGRSLGAAVATVAAAKLHHEKGALVHLENGGSFSTTSKAAASFIRFAFKKIGLPKAGETVAKYLEPEKILVKSDWQIDAATAYKKIPATHKTYFHIKGDNKIDAEASLQAGLEGDTASLNTGKMLQASASFKGDPHDAPLSQLSPVPSTSSASELPVGSNLDAHEMEKSDISNSQEKKAKAAQQLPRSEPRVPSTAINASVQANPQTKTQTPKRKRANAIFLPVQRNNPSKTSTVPDNAKLVRKNSEQQLKTLENTPLTQTNIEILNKPKSNHTNNNSEKTDHQIIRESISSMRICLDYINEESGKVASKEDQDLLKKLSDKLDLMLSKYKPLLERNASLDDLKLKSGVSAERIAALQKPINQADYKLLKQAEEIKQEAAEFIPKNIVEKPSQHVTVNASTGNLTRSSSHGFGRGYESGGKIPITQTENNTTHRRSGFRAS